MKGKILALILVLILFAIYYFLIRTNTNNKNIHIIENDIIENDIIENDSTLFLDNDNMVEKPKNWQLYNVELSCSPSIVFISIDSSPQNLIATAHALRTNEEIAVLPEQAKLQYIDTSTGGFIGGDYFLCVKCEDASIVSQKISINDGSGLKVSLVVKQAFILDENTIKRSFKAAISNWEQYIKMVVVAASEEISSKLNATLETTSTYAAMLAGDSISQAISKYYALESENPAFPIINTISKSYTPDLTEKLSVGSFRTSVCRSIDAAGKNINTIDEAYLKFKTKYNISSASKLTYQDIDVLIAKCIATDFPTGETISVYLILNLLETNQKF